MSPQSNDKKDLGLNKRWVRTSEGKWISESTPYNDHIRPFSQDREASS